MLKRIFDILLSIAGIIVLSPLWILIVLFILLEDGLPIFFRQERIGKDGKPFVAIKFRTMKHSPGDLHLDIDLKDDPRVTRVGKFLRATGNDEFIQLFNILKGNMSFVGPRPLPMKIDDDEKLKYSRLDQVPGFKIRSSVRPGMTGPSQIYASKELCREEKFKYDIEYINNNNLWLDIKLIITSFWITARGAWEKRENKL